MRDHPVLCNAFLAVAAVAIAAALHAITRRTTTDSWFRRRAIRAELAALAMLTIVFVLLTIEWQMARFLCFLGCEPDALQAIVRAWAPWTVSWCAGAACFAAWNAPWIREPAG